MSRLATLYPEHSDLADEWHEAFLSATGSGRAPSTVRAAIEWLTTPKSQEEAAAEFGAAPHSIRNAQQEILADGPIDDAVATECKSARACPSCSSMSAVYLRVDRSPPWRCSRCAAEFETPAEKRHRNRNTEATP